MRKRFSQYLNEAVSITIMLLMAVALIAAQSKAGDLVRESGVDAPVSVVTVDAK